MPSRRKNHRKTSRKSSRKTAFWNPGSMFDWLTSTGHSKKHSRKGSRSKRSEAYVASRRPYGGISVGLKQSTAYCKKSDKYGSRPRAGISVGLKQSAKYGSRPNGARKGRSSVVCVCATITKKKNGSKKSSVAYRERSRGGIPKLRQGTLRKHGYSSKAPSKARHESLSNAVIEFGPTVVIRKLNVIATLSKNKNPELAAKFKGDSAWVKKTFGTTAHPV